MKPRKQKIQVWKISKKEYDTIKRRRVMFGAGAGDMIWKAPNNKYYRIAETGMNAARAMYEFNKGISKDEPHAETLTLFADSIE